MTTARGAFLISLANLALLWLSGRWDITLHWMPATLSLVVLAVTWIFVCDAMVDESDPRAD